MVGEKKKFFCRKEIDRALLAQTIALENRPGFHYRGSWRRERARSRARVPLQHSKVIRSPEGSVNCFSRREAADGEGSEDPDPAPTPLSDVQIVSPSSTRPSFSLALRADFASMIAAPKEIILARVLGSSRDNSDNFASLPLYARYFNVDDTIENDKNIYKNIVRIFFNRSICANLIYTIRT